MVSPDEEHKGSCRSAGNEAAIGVGWGQAAAEKDIYVGNSKKFQSTETEFFRPKEELVEE